MESNFELKPIHIYFVPQEQQRYNTIGDYGENHDATWFKITRFDKNPEYSIACLIHEIHEFFRNKQEGISVESVDDFDLANEHLDEPGESIDAPYHKTHMEADILERAVLKFMGGDWIEYEAAINNLFEEK